jgi:lipid A 4'-phosphatase
MRGAAIYAGLVVAALALFLLVPQLDLWVSGLFWHPGRGFVLRDWAPVNFTYRAIPWITWGVILVAAAAAAWLFLMQRPLWRFDRKALLFVALSTALGPGLLANTVLKDHWDRARPTKIEAFGGTRHFTPAPLPSTECPRNCSFVSGHAALGFSLVAFGFLLPPGRERRRAIAAALGFGAFVGLVRIAQGGHFLSDVVWAGLLVFGTTAALHWWIVERDGFAAPALLRLYGAIGRRAAATALLVQASQAARLGIVVALTAVLVVVSIDFVDRPLALYLHGEGPDVRALFDVIAELGAGWGWLTLFGLAFVALHWGGEAPLLRPAAARMRAFSAVPAFLFASNAAAGLVVDLLKVGFGRMRPKLLFGHDLYGFTWLGWRPDHWSFPSGHTTTFVALMAALWCLWPRHLLFYILAGAIVAAARVIGGAHYPSDVVAAALIAVLVTRGMAVLFDRGGIDLAAARQGRAGNGEAPPWPCRCFGELLAARRARAGPLLAPQAGGVVSPRHDGAADRDF